MRADPMNTPAGGVTLPEVKAAIAEADSRWTAFIRQPYDATAGLDLAAKNAEAYASHLALAYCRAALAGEWREIDDPPEAGVPVLCYFTDGDSFDVSINDFDGNKWQPHVLHLHGLGITHWMPLPAAPLPKEPGR